MPIRSYDQRSDKELVKLCNDGSRKDAIQAFDTLYKRHKDYVTRVSLRFGSDSEIAADVLQETFLYLLKKFPPSGNGLVLTAQLQTLLYPVAKNLTLTELRRRRRFEGPENFDPDLLPDPVSVGFEDEDLKYLSSVLSGLSSKHREVLLLRFVDDMSLKEIMETLSIPLGTVKSRLHLAIRELRNVPYINELRES